MSRRVGLLWSHVLPDGGIYLSGFIEALGGDIKIKVVKNLYREKDAHADMVILRKETQVAEEMAAIE